MKGGEKMMKTIFRLFMVALLSLAFAGPASAVIRNSKHDFSISSAANSATYSTDEDRMCVFCHTPHNAVENVPLWNRSGGTAAYLLYTTSATLTSATKASVIDADNISYKCLSCHDGTISIGGGAVNGNIDTNQSGATPEDKVTNGFDIGAAASNSLTDDHPIGFDFERVSTGTGPDTNIKSMAQAIAVGLKFYKAGTKVNQMECASCHDVHGQAAATKFLRTDNAQSALCLSCHIK